MKLSMFKESNHLNLNLRAPVLELCKVILNFFLLSVLGFVVLSGSSFSLETEFNRYNYIGDPYLPFLPYESRDAMLADFQSKLGDVYQQINNDTLNQQTQTLVDEAYAGLKSLYPKFMSNKTKPQFVLVKSDDGLDIQAYLPKKYNNENAHKGLMIFTTGFLEAKISRTVKLGWVLHEMSHLFFWHFGGNVTPIRIFYKNGSQITPSEIQNFMAWLYMASVVGWVSYDEMNGITMDSQIGDGVNELLLKLAEIDSPQCGKNFSEKVMEIKNSILLKNVDQLLWDVPLSTTESKNQMNEGTNAMLGLIRACLSTQPASINKVKVTQEVQYILKNLGVVHPYLDGDLGDREMTFDQYIDLAKKSQARMRVLQQGFDYNRLHYYSAEDQADEISITVLKALGYDSQQLARTHLDYLEAEGPGLRQQCEAIVESGGEPPFGNLMDEHHAPCWRFYNLSHFSRTRTRIPGLR